NPSQFLLRMESSVGLRNRVFYFLVMYVYRKRKSSDYLHRWVRDTSRFTAERRSSCARESGALRWGWSSLPLILILPMRLRTRSSRETRSKSLSVLRLVEHLMLMHARLQGIGASTFLGIRHS